MHELGLEVRAVQMPRHAGLQPIECRHQGLGDITAAERAVAASSIGKFGGGRGVRAKRSVHESCSSRAAAARAARTNS